VDLAGRTAREIKPEGEDNPPRQGGASGRKSWNGDAVGQGRCKLFNLEGKAWECVTIHIPDIALRILFLHLFQQLVETLI
jgi:hypothetical protein